MKVSNMIGTNGTPVKNQFIIIDGNKEIFQSYDSVIAVKENNTVTLDKKYWDYSSTTSKYRNLFLHETTKKTQEKIKAGIYKLANLN